MIKLETTSSSCDMLEIFRINCGEKVMVDFERENVGER